ncbi:glycosyltransferase [Vulcanisaeta distributa]|uniref:Glycosyl transferase group 1 n=1 Tax=Vulcanisaeta distributa (strain DSM 14429 / JCM 11212 / NBRC 100878 / IC-017) TaxID=572478 RepID=E1QP92_VULDI|nr:glycosyltransferase [Vulcanisaeta distributa]ADN50263.1 glycosyl transferase group 1 [Vulcanisaeta distributa DSM 14429]
MDGHIAYITRFNPMIFPRPLFMKKAIPGLNIYLLSLRRSLFYNEPISGETNGGSKQAGVTHGLINAVKGIDPLRIIEPCHRQDGSFDGLSLTKEMMYGILFFKKLRERYVIIKNTIGALAAINNGKRVIIDLMDLWHCERNYVIFNSIDLYTLRRARCVIAWSKAITALLRRSLPGQCVEYLPFGIDLDLMDPLRSSSNLLFERYPDLNGKVIIGYSGGGEWYHGIDKLIQAFSLIEKFNKDEIYLVIQTWGQNQRVKALLKGYGLRHYELVPGTLFNDPLRLSLLRASNILILTASESPGVYLAERSTMFHYMASGNAIVAEETPGTLGVLRHMKTAYMFKFNNVKDLANGILLLIDDGNLMKKLGMNARYELETKYSWNNALKVKLNKILDEVMND